MITAMVGLGSVGRTLQSIGRTYPSDAAEDGLCDSGTVDRPGAFVSGSAAAIVDLCDVPHALRLMSRDTSGSLLTPVDLLATKSLAQTGWCHAADCSYAGPCCAPRGRRGHLSTWLGPLGDLAEVEICELGQDRCCIGGRTSATGPSHRGLCPCGRPSLR
jgi:hypothetical protein